MKVRIYKSPDGNGKYLNKTGQFLEKAQKGKIVKNILQYGKQLVMNFDEADKIQKATELAKAIDKSNRLARAAGAIKYGEGVKKAVTTSSKIHIKNPSYYQQILDMTNNLSPSTRQFHNDVLKSVNKSKGMVSQKQYNILKNIENGTFNKYQLGGVPDVSEMGYPGSNSEEKKDLSQDELVNIISNDLNNDIDEQQIAFKLANFYDVDPMEAINLVSQVKNYLIEQNDSEYEYDFDEDENEDEDEVVEEEDVEEVPYESEEEVIAAEDTQNSNVATDLTLGDDEEDDDDEDDEDDDDDDEEKYGGQMAYGGLYKAQDGEEVEDVNTEIQQNDQVTYPFNPTAPDIVFPEIETYLPYNMADMLNGNVDPATGTYYNHYASKDINQNSEYEDEEVEEEEVVEKNPIYAEDQQYYEENNIPKDGNVYGDYKEGDIIDPALDPNIIVNKYGGQMKMGGSYKRNKKVYVNSILKLAKKAEGGEEQKSDNDPEAGDPTGAKIRKQKLNNFIGSLKKETEMFNLKQQAEQQYDQMMQQQQQLMPPQNQMMQNGGSREPRVVRGNELRYRANQLKDFITGQNRRDREDNIDYFNVNDYPTSNFEEGDYNKDGYTDAMDFASSPEQLKLRNNTTNQGHVTSSTEPKIGQTWDDWWVTSTGNTPGFVPDNRKWNGKDWISSKEYYGNSDYGNDMFYDKKPSYSIDVRKSNWLTGRPSKYKIDFYGYSPLVDIATGNNSGVVSQKPVVKPSQSTVSSTIATTINKSQSTDLPKQGTLLPHGFFTTDANGDKIPDYLQPGKFSTLPTGPSKEVIIQAAVSPNATVSNTPIISSVYKPEINRNSSPTLIKIKQNKVIIPKNPIPKFTPTNKNKKKTTTKKTKKKSEYYYRDPTFMERLGRFFDPNLENGGYVDSENPDLYEFNYGGYDPTQQDMDYSNSIDTTDPYFQRGGGVRKFIENYFPGNILSPQRTYRNEIQRVYDPRTGKTVNMPIDMGRLSSVDVQKSRFWSGKPKKYTMYFNGSASKPITTSNNTTSNNVSSQSGHDRFCEMFPDSPMCTGSKKNNSQKSNVDGLGLKSRMAIRKGERWNKRNSRRLERQGLDEYGNRPGDEQGAIYNDGRLIKDREGNWYDRYNEKIPDKKRPTDMENWWQNDRYFEQNTKNNEPMSNEELFKSQGKTYDPILKRWLTAGQKTAINMLNPESPTKDESGNLKEQMQSNGIYNYKQYGGNLDTYLPRADTGFQTTLNPGDCPTGSSKNAAGDCIDFTGKVVKRRNTGSDFGNNTPEIKQPPEIKLPGVMDETYKNPLTGEKPGVIRGADGNLKINQETPSFYEDQYAIDVENKRNRGKLAFGNKADTSRNETRLSAFNTGVDIADSFKRNIDSRKSENEIYENYNSNNLYASDPSRDRGDYDTNSGLDKPDAQGEMWNSRSKQFGGYIDEEEYYDPYTEEEDELTYANGGEKITYMSEDQIRAFMAEGGQVEFL